MFYRTRTSTLAQRALGALRLTRSFLLLEDDYDVDWEVDPNEHLQAPHPHRASLRGRERARRAGQPTPHDHVCVTPVRADKGGHRRERLASRSRAGARSC